MIQIKYINSHSFWLALRTNYPFLLPWKKMEFKNIRNNLRWCLINVRWKQWSQSKLYFRYGHEIVFCEYIGILTYYQTSLQLFMWSNGKRKNIYNIYKIVFHSGQLHIVTLTYAHSYLQLLMLNNGKGKIIYENYKHVFHYDKPGPVASKHGNL